MVYEGSSKVLSTLLFVLLALLMRLETFTFSLRLFRNIRMLVGEFNFDYHISRSESHGESSRLVAGGPDSENGEGEEEDGNSYTSYGNEGSSRE